MNKFIPLSVPNLQGNEIKYVARALETEWVSTAGAYITEFENNISKYVKSRGAVACQSGTAGLHLALLVCGVNYGDEIIVPTLTFIAAVNPIKYIGADPIFMDCDDGLTLDAEKLDDFCSNECCFKDRMLINKKTKRHIKAIIVVHVFGNLADMEKICHIAQTYNLKVIEDATEALGSYYINGYYAGKYAGTMGDIGVYSFNGNKIITTGGGGMIVSDNDEYLKKCKYLSTQSKDDEVYFIHNEIGYNYRMTNLQAALGIAQLEQLEIFIETKKKNYNEYINNHLHLLEFRKNIRPNYWFYSLITSKRDRLIQYLNNNKIQTRPIWKLIHMLKPYEESQTYKIEKAYEYYNKVINIPCSSNLTIDEVRNIAEAIKTF